MEAFIASIPPGHSRYSRKGLELPVPYKQYRKEQVKTAYLFITPALLGLAIFTFVPMVSALFLSFTEYNVLTSPKWIGLENYLRLFSDRDFGHSLTNTLLYALGTMPAKIFVSLLLAFLLNRKVKGLALFRGLYYAPEVTSMVAVSIIWLYMYNPQIGLFNIILGKFGIANQAWLFNPKLALPSLMLMGVWKNLGVNMIIYLAALQGVPRMYIEAADLDGATGWQIFWKIIWPLLSHATFFILITNLIGTIQVFDQIYVMTNGGPANATTTVVHQIYLRAFQQFHMGYASAMAFCLSIIIFALTLLNFRLRKTIDY